MAGQDTRPGELLRILLRHPESEIAFVCSESQQGKPVTAIHQDLLGETLLNFSAHPTDEADVLFICSGHGKSAEILKQYPAGNSPRIIDLSQDFRLAANATQGARQFVYWIARVQ